MNQTLNQYIEEKMPTIKKVLTILVVLTVVSSILLFTLLSKPTTIPYPNPTNLTQCKLNAWVSCGLKVTEDMCWKLKTNNDSQWDNCTLISNSTANCWVNQSMWCNINFAN